MQRRAFVLVVLSALAACAPKPPPAPIGPRGPSAGLFVSPMGEPIRSSAPGADLIGTWFAAVDGDRDGVLTPAEMQADAARFFRTLDSNGDGELTPPEMVRYEREVAPEIQLGSQLGPRRRPGQRGERPEQSAPGEEGERPRRRDEQEIARLPQGATRYALLDLPQPVAAADADFNRAVSAAEFTDAAAERFALLDRDRDGRITRQELEPLPLVAPAAR